jgi:hypothetical protein
VAGLWATRLVGCPWIHEHWRIASAMWPPSWPVDLPGLSKLPTSWHVGAPQTARHSAPPGESISAWISRAFRMS